MSAMIPKDNPLLAERTWTKEKREAANQEKRKGKKTQLSRKRQQ
jgi:hypothetical protein